MISCTEFIPAYSELFSYLDEKYGREEVDRFWKYLFQPDGKGIPLINHVQKEGIRGCFTYWAGSLNEEAADFTMYLNENCWFDGKITGTQWLGGIVGFIDGNTKQTDISNCLVTADITATVDEGKNAYIGGLTARMANGTVDSCVVAGELKGNGLVSGLIGMTVTKPTQKLEIIKCYNASNESRLYDTALQKPTAREVKNVSLEQLKGTQAYTYTLLDFYDAQRNTNAKWVLVENQIPELKSFAKATYVADLGSLQGIARPIVADTSWYNTTDKKFTISTAEQLYGFAELCNSGNKFTGQTVILGADITVNEGKATDWAKGINVPAINRWTPIGGGVSSNDYIGFAGTFDGNGKTISGLYMKSDGLYLGLFGTLAMDGSSTIKNLKLTNSYFECTREKANGNELDGLGSIAGQGAGVIDTVYSDAIVVSKTRNVGGLIGNQRHKKSPLAIQNCWFDGSVIGTQWVGGLIGFVYKDVEYTNMTDCLVTAELTSTYDAKANEAYIGGLAGRLSKGEIRSCVAQGTIVTPATEAYPTGFVRAIVDTATLSNLYNAMQWNGKAVENYYDNVKPTTEKLYKLSEDNLKGTKAYANTLLDFYDKNTNKTAKWVLRENKLLTLKSFAGQDYMADLSSLASLNILPMPARVLSNLENGLRDKANEHIYEQHRLHPECVVMPYVLPCDSEETIYAMANQPGVKGFKCYCYGANAKVSEYVAIHDFVPEAAWVVANEKKMIMELHIMRPNSLSDEGNFSYIMQMTKKYPNAQLVLAHCARAFAAWTCIDSIKRLDDQGNIWFDMAAVCESGPMMACILKNAGKRTMWGSDYPVCMNRGRAISLGVGQEWLVGERFENLNRAYVATENLMAFWQASRLLDLDKTQISDLFYNNAVELFMV